MASSSSSSLSSIDFSTAILIRVDQSGKGDFNKIQEAIESIPPNLNNSQLYFIWVKPGVYREKVVIPVDKPYITLSGTKASNTILEWSDAGQAVAVRVAGDNAAFYGCVIKSYQDTLLDDDGNHYFKNCYIEGATDFICGNASSLYERCHLHSLSPKNGSITAQKRTSATEKSGYIFLGCKLTALYIMVNTNVNGPGADRTQRVKWSKQLSDDEATVFLSKDFIGGKDWLRPVPSHFKNAPKLNPT
ncbi:hypothetical protein DY000_02034040 [Brassica cretica]|uniref:pectinesterase n=1 Tax=Brassica cretica TaxID=69181 RepID=A0ABQ7DTZ6_BRACR|nr:hypothetical protein DY000_02034040 [Brassica cretica]